mmetsp:Transcript_158376/g.508002  ORF Transcript_158376/g.508002 Transcript_158376/m.508002 type:complete len:206 (-) Transcript_158376:767-1384(-)
MQSRGRREREEEPPQDHVLHRRPQHDGRHQVHARNFHGTAVLGHDREQGSVHRHAPLRVARVHPRDGGRDLQAHTGHQPRSRELGEQGLCRPVCLQQARVQVRLQTRAVAAHDPVAHGPEAAPGDRGEVAGTCGGHHCPVLVRLPVGGLRQRTQPVAHQGAAHYSRRQRRRGLGHEALRADRPWHLHCRHLGEPRPHGSGPSPGR